MSFTRKTYKDAIGTGYQGEISITYNELVQVFGEPDKGMDDKVKAEWTLKFSDGTIAIIYDWKFYDLQPEDVTLWNIGGNKRIVVDLVLNELGRGD